MSRLVRLITFVSLSFVLAACGVDGPTTEVTTTDPVVEQDVESSESEELRVDAGSPENQDELELDPPVVPEAPAVTSPAGRQDAQSVGGVDPETDRAADGAQGSAPVAGQAAEASAEPVGQTGQASVAPAPTGPVIDIPIPSVAQSGTADTAEAEPAAPFVSAGSSEDSSADLDGLELEIAEVDALEAGGGDGVAIAELQPEPVPVELTNGEADEVCPQGAPSDCVSDVEALPVDDGAANGALDGEGAAALDEPDCESRPWMVGCDGPVPEPGDFEPQATVESQATDPSAGVQVPQEIQDLLLAPIDE